MGIIDFLKNNKIDYDKAAEILVATGLTNLDPFLKKGVPEICNIFETDITNYEMGTFYMESFLLFAWTTMKALEYDKQVLRKAVYNRFLSCFKNKEQRHNVSKLLDERSARYESAWDDKSEGNQSILAVNILAIMFNHGNIEGHLLDFRALVFIQQFLMDTMKLVLQVRKKMHIITA